MNKKILSTNVILGSILLFSYYFLGTKNTTNIEALWGNIKGNTRKLYIVSIFLATIAYIGMLYFIVFKVKNNVLQLYKIHVSQVILLLASLIWLPLTISYLGNNNILKRTGIIFTLFIVVSSALSIVTELLKIEYNGNDDLHTLAIVCGVYFLIHVFFLDFLGWSYNFFK